MISWLEGKLLEIWEKGSHLGIILNCNGIGYEVNLKRCDCDQLPELGKILSLYIHMIIREKERTLYGFLERSERDLFCELISVRGIGPQIAFSLQSKLRGNALVNAIIKRDLETLSQVQGIGKRTAEKLLIELHHRFSEKNIIESPCQKETLDNQSTDTYLLINELKVVLISLGYKDCEIQQAINLAISKSNFKENSNFEFWLREILYLLDKEIP